MIKKAIKLLSGAVLAGAFIVAASVNTKAALPSTIDIINDANAQIAAANAAYEAAKANEANLLAAFNAIKANPAHGQLEYEQAAFNYANAVNVTKWNLDQLNNAKAYLKNISDRGNFEDKFWANRAAVEALTTLKSSKQEADGAANIANGLAQQIANVEKAIAGYQTQLAVSPYAYQAAIDSLTVKLNALKAEYAKYAADASAKAAVFENNLNTLNYKDFNLAFDNYQHQREWQRENPSFDLKEMRWMGPEEEAYKSGK